MTAMLPEPAYVLSPRPVRPDLVVFNVCRLGYSGLYLVSLKRGSRYYPRFERFTCCKSIAAIYYRIYEEQHEEDERRKSLFRRKPKTETEDDGFFGLDIDKPDFRAIALWILGIVVVFLLLLELYYHLTACFGWPSLLTPHS